MKRGKKILFMIPILLLVIGSFIFTRMNTKEYKINRVLRSKYYSYLPKEAKEYVKEVYEETGNIILTEKNKEENKLYLNPQYVEYLTYSDQEKEDLGEVPFSLIVDYSSTDITESGTIPNKYDLRSDNGNNYVTPVRNQGKLGICWAFATAGVAESHLLKTNHSSYHSSSTLISERQIDYATSRNGIKDYKSEYVSFVKRSLGDGGNFYISTIALANGISFVDYHSFKEYNDTDLQKMELSDVLSYDKSLYEVNSTINFPRISLRDSTSILTDEEVETRNSYLNEVKQNIMKNGAAYVSTYMGSNCQYVDSNLHNTVIDVYECNYSGGHAMEIIGWDDDLEYSYCADTRTHNSDTTNCNRIVSGKGVWILKNSWGDSIPYPYLTYDSLYTSISFMNEVENSQDKNWDNNYILGSGTEGAQSVQYTLSNTKIKNDEKIKKVKFITLSPDAEYHVKIKKKDGAYETFSKKSELPGLMTIDITKDIVVDNNTEIMIYSDYDFIDKTSIFTSNVDSTATIDLSKYDNMTLTDSDIRLYSETKNISSGATITYKLYNSNGLDVSNKATFTNNVVAENNINTVVSFSDSLESDVYRLDTLYQSNVVNSIHINKTKMDGLGTKNSPYIITTPVQLYQIRDHLDAFYELGNDIDLTEETHEGGRLSLASEVCPQGFGWEAIHGFSGSLDGKGHTIKGLYQNNYLTCNEEKETWYELNNNGNGLFATMKENAVVKNLVLEDFDITCQGGDCGALVSRYIANMNDSEIIDWSNHDEYTATFENIAIKNSKMNAISKKNKTMGGGLFCNVQSVHGNVNISNIYLDIQLNTDQLNNGSYLISYFQVKNADIENIRVMGNLIGKQIDGSGGEAPLISKIVGDDTINIRNVLSTVTTTQVKDNLIYNNNNDKLTIDSVNLIDTNEPLCSESNRCKNTSNINVYNKENQIKEFTKTTNYSSWSGFNTNWIVRTVDGITRMPALKFMNFEYTNIDDIELDSELNHKRSIYDYITPKIDAAKRIIYRSNDESIVKIDENGIFIPQSNGNTTIHVESLYDGYIKDVPIHVDYTPHYTIYFDANGGEGEMESLEVQTGNNAVLPENQFEKEHYEFNGWNTKKDGTGTSYADLGQVASLNDKETIILYAQWIGEELVVTFDPDGGTVSPDRKIVHYGGTYEEFPIPVKDGYAFKYWYSNGSVVYSALQKISALHFTASWVENAFGIIYDANGGEHSNRYDYSNINVLSSSQLYKLVEKGDNVSLLSGGYFKRDGYLFKEWNTKADGSGKSYQDSADIDVNDFENELTTLYAIWDEQKVELSSTPSSIDYGEVRADFYLPVSKKVKIQNTGDIDLSLSINNPTSVGPFGSQSFENGKILKPGEEYEVTLILNPNGTNHNKPGTYNGVYKIIGTDINNDDNQFTLEIPSKVVINPLPMSVSYMTHVQDYGDQKYVRDGAMSGTSGQSKRLEAIRIKLENQSYTGNIEYRTHVEDYGWMSYVKNGAMSGTSHEAKRLEAIQIRLTGELSEKYDVYYRVHAQDVGWMNWAKNDEMSGTAGYGRRLEGIEIVVVEKGQNPPVRNDLKTTKAFIQKQVSYTTHVQDYGWQSEVADGAMSGTSHQSKRLEGIKIKLYKPAYSGSIRYKTHVQDIGWQNFVYNGAMSGTSGQSKRLEAIRIELTGNMSSHYDIYYRVHAEHFGWMNWAKNGESAGTAHYGYRLEGIEIVIVDKGEAPPTRSDIRTNNAFY